jgi:peptidoglycan/LPS O-acetylase OafA/YrhL
LAAKEIEPLTGLRGLAAIGVMATHLCVSLNLPMNFVIAHGTWGLCVFFVLSGFIIGHVYDREFSRSVEAASTMRYLGLRLAKIYPVHLFMLIAWVGFLVPNFMWPEVAWNDSTSFALNLLLVQGWGFLPDFTWNIVSWSISVEWACYLLFPMLPWLLSRRSTSALILIAAAIGAAVYSDAAVKLIGMLSRTGPGLTLAAGKQLSHYALMFLFGYVAFLLNARIPSIRLVLVWDLLIAAVLVAVWGAAERPDLDQWIPIASAVVIVCLAQPCRAFCGFLLSNPIAKYLGEISYCIYMCHVFVHAVLANLWETAVPQSAPSLGTDIAITLVFAAALYHGIEQPARRVIRGIVLGADRAALLKAALPDFLIERPRAVQPAPVYARSRQPRVFPVARVERQRLGQNRPASKRNPGAALPARNLNPDFASKPGKFDLPGFCAQSGYGPLIERKPAVETPTGSGPAPGAAPDGGTRPESWNSPQFRLGSWANDIKRAYIMKSEPPVSRNANARRSKTSAE